MDHLARLLKFKLLSRWLIIGGITIPTILFAVNLYLSRLVSPLPTLEMIDRHGRYICEVRDGGDDAEAGYWPIESIPDRVRLTVLAVEDHRFYLHPGIDPLAICRAFVQNIRSGCRVSGASTIAMQVARLQRPSPRNYRSKLREMLDAICLTTRYGRTRILGHYLTIAPYGNGIRGLKCASRRYLDKPVEDLSWAEIAFLCAIPQQPNRMNPRTPHGRVRVVKRARQILGIVRELDMMTAFDYQRAMDQVASIVISPRRRVPDSAIHLALRFREQASRDRAFFMSPVVQTAIDLELQEYIVEQTGLCLRTWAVAGARNGAVMVIDSETNEVVSLLGSRDYFSNDDAGAIDYTSVRRSPGSTLKPFIYALALENGIVAPDGFLNDDFQRARGFQNFDHIWLGSINVGNALASSRNIPAVDLLRKTGVYRTYGCLADLKLHDYEVDCERYGLGMAIGGLPVTMEQLARAYTVFTNGGHLAELIWYRSDGPIDEREIFSQETVAWISRYLSNPVDRLPSFPRMGNLEYDYPVAVKTGTSEGCRDAWTVAWSSRYLVLVWLGRPDGQIMNGVGGYQSAAGLARVIMDRLHETLQENPSALSPFTIPEQRDESKGHTKRLLPVAKPAATDISITSPENNAIYYIDPETPSGASTLLLAADIALEPDAVITWIIDGQHFRSCAASQRVFWPMSPGKHVFQVKLKRSPGTMAQVTVTIRNL